MFDGTPSSSSHLADAPGDRLPSGPELAAQLGVARMTVQQAVRLLRSEGLVVSRQGSGVFVRERTQRSVELRPQIEQAFESDQVDFAGFSAETLHGVLAEPLDKIRAGRLAPESITLRLLLPDTSRPMVLPCAADDLTDDPGMRRRGHGLQQRQVGAIAKAAGELEELGLVRRVDLDVRLHALPPLFKLFIVNDDDVFFGFYPIQRRTIPIDQEEHDVFDLTGKDAVMFRSESATGISLPLCRRCPTGCRAAATTRVPDDLSIVGARGMAAAYGGNAIRTDGGRSASAP